MTDFPISPIINQIHAYGGITYKWNGEKWVITPGAVRRNINDVTFGAVDLSKGTFHKISTNESCVVSFENIPTGSSRWGMEIDINGMTKYDLVNSSSTAPIASLSLAAAETTPYQLFFKPTGDKLYVVGYTNDRVNTYNLTTPWDITTAVITSNTFIVSGFELNPYALSFDPTGRYMYIGGATRNVFQFELSERWNVSTATLSKTKSVNPPMATNGPICMQFSPDGDKMFALGLPNVTAGQRYVYEYILSTPWDVSTATYTTGDLLQVGLLDSGAHSFAFRPDGKKMYMIGSTNNRVYQYTLSTPWKVNTAVSDGVSFIQAATAEATSTNIMFNPDGSRMFISGQTLGTLREYRTSYSRAAYSGTFTFPSNVIWNNNTTPVLSAPSGEGAATIATSSVLDFTTPDGGGTIYASEKFNKALYKPSTAPPIKFTRLLGSLSGTLTTWTYNTLTVPTSITNPLSCRFVVEFVIPSVNAASQMDSIYFNFTQYQFDGSGHGFEYAYIVSGEYRNVVTWTAVPWSTTGVTDGAWSAVYSGVVATGDASLGSLYALGSSIGAKLFLRSPLVTLASGAQPSIGFLSRRPNGGTHNYYITNF